MSVHVYNSFMDTLSQAVTRRIRHWVLQGKFKPGERLEEIPLTKLLNVSRTPVRAALATLGNEGLLEHQPKRGYTVRVYSYDDILGAYEVRSVLEGLACRKAAQNGLSESTLRQLRAYLKAADVILACGELRPEDLAPYQEINVGIHECIIEAAGNSWVKRFATQAQTTPFASDRIMLWDDYEIIYRSHGDHHRIVDALEARDAPRAEDLMREHVYYAGILLTQNYKRLTETMEGG